MIPADLGRRILEARGQRDPERYLGIVKALVQLAQRTAGQRLSPEWIQQINDLIRSCYLWEASWALHLGQILWRDGQQLEFFNQWNLATFAGFTGRHSLIQSDSHAQLAREFLSEATTPALQLLLGNALRHQGQFAAAEDAYLQGIQRWPEVPFLRLRLAAMYLATCRMGQARALLHPMQARWPSAREMLFAGPLDGLPEPKMAPLPAFPETAREAVLLLVADPAYMERYAEGLLKSLPVGAGTRLHVHFHVVADHNAPPPQELLNRLMRHCTSSFMSLRRTDLAGLSDERRRALLASERFLILADVLAQYQRPVIVPDVDLECVGDCMQLLDTLGADELAVSELRGGYEAWERYAATLVLARPTPAVIAFFQRMRRFLLTELNRHPNPWFVDQVGLFRLLEEGEGPRCRVRILRGLFCEAGGPSAGAMFRLLHASWTQLDGGT